MNKPEVDLKDITFRDKIEDFLAKLEEDLKNTDKELEFHKAILKVFNESNTEHEYLLNLKESIEETEKFIKALKDRKHQGTKLLQFLKGDLVLDFDKFVFLMIDVIGTQMVNYVELKNEFYEVSKKWNKEK